MGLEMMLTVGQEDRLRFVLERLNRMAATPGMWATNKESFSVQLALLVEVAFLDPKQPIGEVIFKTFGPYARDAADLIEDEWARQKVQVCIDYIQKKLSSF